MSKPLVRSFLRDLQMPLRDALRGAASLADATEDMLEPAAQLFPEPLRSRFRDALGSLERVGKRLIHFPIRIEQIEAASGFLRGEKLAAATPEACATVFVYAWEYLHESNAAQRHMISETLVTERMRGMSDRSRATGADFAAALLADIRNSSAIGLMPGLTRSISTVKETGIDLALLTIGVWLLTGRASTMIQEEKLLDLSMALVRALQKDAEKALEDNRCLARFLADTSAHL